MMGSRQGHEAGPPLEFAAEFNVVFVCNAQFSILSNAEDRQSRRHIPGVVAIAHVHINNTRGDQYLSTRIDAERANVEAQGVFVLDERRFPGGRVNGEDRYIVLAATEDFLSVEVHGGIGAV